MPTLAEANAILNEGDLLFSAEQVAAATTRVALEINRDYPEKYPLVLSVMGGAVVFTGHLLSQLDFPLDFDIVQASRYGNAKVGAELTWRVAPRDNIAGRHVIILDDILDEGVTLAAIVDLVKKQGALSVACAVFCVKDYGSAINAKNRSRPTMSVLPCRIGLCSATAWMCPAPGATCQQSMPSRANSRP